MQKTNIQVEMAGTASNFHLHTPDYKTWFYLELRPEPTLIDLSGYPVPSIFNVVHKLKDGSYFICGIKAFKNMPVKAREVMLNEQLKEYDIHLNSTDTTNALMSIPVIATTPHIMDKDDYKAALNRLKNHMLNMDSFMTMEKYRHTDIASYYPETGVARKVFLYVMEHASNANYSGEYPLPPYVKARISKHWIDGHTYVILYSYDEQVAVWDVDNHILVYTAEKVMPMKHVFAFTKWADERVLDGIPIKRIKI